MVSVSIRKPVKIAAGISPIEAVRFTPAQKDIRSRKKNIKLNPVSMGIANFKRDRKKTVAIVASLSLGGIILLVVRRISRSTSFTSVSNAQSVISQARQFANDKYLSNCTDLKNALNSVRNEIAQSHYRYISAQVEKLSQYRYFSQSYYDNTLVPQVDAAVTEYDNKAAALYGKKQSVEPLWARARSYYNQASSYYNNYNQ